MDDNRIEQFLDGEITESELGKEGKLDHEVYEELAASEMLMQELVDRDEAAARDYLKNLDPLPIESPWKKRIVIAAILLIGIAIYMISRPAEVPKLKKEEIINQFAYLFPSENIERSISDEELELIAGEARKLYAQKKYSEYIRYTKDNKILDQLPKTILFKISSYLALEEYQKALELIESSSSNDMEVVQNMDWYRVISYLGLDITNSAKEQLEEISKIKSHRFNRDALDMMKELEE